LSAVVSAAQGEVWLSDLGHPAGHEQGGRRPCVVISVDQVSSGPAGLAIVVPCTTTDRRVALHVRIEPPEGGLSEPSFALPEQVRAISRTRLVTQRGKLRDGTLTEIIRRVRVLCRPPERASAPL
jgi:mRNA interferase MazF